MRIIGLTGSIGMGKSTTCGFFRQLGTPVFDADLCVHSLYEGEAVPTIEAEFPSVIQEGRVDRTRLAAKVLADPHALRRLEALVHPLVQAARRRFLADAHRANCRVVVLDIPLLFETASEGAVDVVLTVSAPESIQAERVMRRPGMTAQKFAEIKSRQMADQEKRRRSHAIVETGGDFESVIRQVVDLHRALTCVEPTGLPGHA